MFLDYELAPVDKAKKIRSRPWNSMKTRISKSFLGNFQPFTNIFEKLIPALNERGFSQSDWNQLLIENPKQAFQLR